MGFFDGIADFVSAPFKSVFSGENTGGFGSTGFLFGKGSLTELFNNPSEWWDHFKNGNASDIARENLQYQRDNLDYQKALQQQIFNREDTAYSRTAADMRMAGLNPLSMQGTNSAGEAIQTTPLHNDGTSSGDLSALNTIFNAFNAFRSAQSNATLQNAQSNLINAQAQNQQIKNIYENDILSSNLSFLKKQSEGINWDNKMKELNFDRGNLAYLNEMRDFDFNNTFGITNSMSDQMELATLIYHSLTGKNLFQGKTDIPTKKENGIFNFNTGNFNTSKTRYGDDLKAALDENFPNMMEKLNQTKTAISESALGSMFLKLLGF